MVIYANICKQSPNEFLKTLIIKVCYKTQTDQMCVTARALLHQRGTVKFLFSLPSQSLHPF